MSNVHRDEGIINGISSLVRMLTGNSNQASGSEYSVGSSSSSSSNECQEQISNDDYDVRLFMSLMKAQAINCNQCQELLTVPVMLVDNKGSLCDSCYTDGIREKKWQNGIPNSSIEAVLNTINMLCRNREYGCMKILPHKDLNDHYKSCEYNPIKCPNLECTFEGVFKQLKLHFKEMHKDDILNPENNEYVLEFPRSKNYKKLLLTREYLIELIASISKDLRKMNFQLINIVDNKPYEGWVKIMGRKKRVSVEYKLLVTPRSGNIDEFLSSEKTIYSHLFTNILNPKNKFTCVFSIRKCSGGVMEIKFIENILNVLSCPTCYNIMRRPNILLCINGHSICRSCKHLLTYCPICQGIYTSYEARNYALENISDEIDISD